MAASEWPRVEAQDGGDAQVGWRPGSRFDECGDVVSPRQAIQLVGMEEGRNDRCPGRHQQEPRYAGKAAGQDAAHHEAGRHDADEHDHRRFHADRNRQHQAGDQRLSPESAETGAGAGVASLASVGHHALRHRQAVRHPGQRRVGGQRGEASLGQRVVRQRDGEVCEDGYRPRPSSPYRADQAPDADGADREGGKHGSSQKDGAAPGEHLSGKADEGEPLVQRRGYAPSGGSPAGPPGQGEVERFRGDGLEPPDGRQPPRQQMSRPEPEHRSSDEQRNAPGPEQGGPELVQPEAAGCLGTRADRRTAGDRPVEGTVRYVVAHVQTRLVATEVVVDGGTAGPGGGHPAQVPGPCGDQAPDVSEPADEEPVGHAQQGRQHQFGHCSAAMHRVLVDERHAQLVARPEPLGVGPTPPGPTAPDAPADGRRSGQHRGPRQPGAPAEVQRAVEEADLGVEAADRLEQVAADQQGRFGRGEDLAVGVVLALVEFAGFEAWDRRSVPVYP